MSIVIINLHSGRARLKTCHYEYLNALTVVSMVIKRKKEILPPAAEDLPYSVLLISAGHASLSLPSSFGGNVRICSVSLQP